MIVIILIPGSIAGVSSSGPTPDDGHVDLNDRMCW